MNISKKLILSSLCAINIFSCTKDKASSEPKPSDQKTEVKAEEKVLTKEEQCAERVKNLPADYISGYLKVPEDPNQVDGRQISVFYYGRVKPDPTIKQDITVFFNGGPGGSSQGTAGRYAKMQKEDPEKNKVNFLFIDQRGTGCSDPFPQGTSKDIVERLRHYGSTGIVSDAELIRKKLLGGQKWRVFGHSYGAWIAHRYVLMAPQSLTKVYANAGVIIENQTEYMAARITSSQRVLKEYFKIYPKDEVKLQTLKKYLDDKPCMEIKGAQYCGHEIDGVLLNYLKFKPFWQNINEDLNLAVDDNLNINLEKIKGTVEWYLSEDTSNPYTQFVATALAYLDVNSIYLIPGIGGDDRDCDHVYAYLREKGYKPETFMINECQNYSHIYNDGSIGKRVPVDYSVILEVPHDRMDMQKFKETLIKNPQIEFFLYSGEVDPVVPVEIIKPEVDYIGDLKNFNYTSFPDVAHDGYFTQDQIWKDLLKN